ncbi:hypothetical protein [Pseudomonas sp. TCU-HL1]|uniref:hypothetical protein n=1 Tax=Pseudomonas sp. TCU-HL1 TaxID=1856685 RepID=UPI00083D48DE|nr:hypothetical protein [Pseudomonas sp. TCU-HL1]AOE85844.1 hypothetical protein THL1_3296 [Pseudomonas sp. TCU-HL1]
MTDLKNEYRIKELERKVSGLQIQVEVLHALHDADTRKRDRQIRDLKINAAVNRGIPRKEVARIYKLSPGRISQLTSRRSA